MTPEIIMAIIALAAIISPAIVAIIDNIFKYNVNMLQSKTPKQQEALSNFVSVATNHYCDKYFYESVEYNVAKNNLYLYFNNVHKIDFDILEEHIKSQDLSAYKLAINDIVKKLSQQIDK